MTTIDNILALADNYATLTADTAAITKAREALVTALTEALAAQPVREPLSQGAKLAVFSDAETAMRRNPNLSWRDAIIDEVERAHGIGGDK